MKSKIFKLVNTGICIGCGLCASVCPLQKLSMHFNPIGEYKPQEKRKIKCSTKCYNCVSVCPFWNKNENEFLLSKGLYEGQTGVQYDKTLGFFLDTFVGYRMDQKKRSKSSSGGVATWFLEELLSSGVVDKIITVKHLSHEGKLFGYKVISKLEELVGSSGSHYYPVEMSKVIRYVIENDHRYAIVGLPCFIKALRLAAKNYELIKERIILTLGLVCGQLPNRFFPAYLLANEGIKHKRIEKVVYRVKSPERPAIDFGINLSYIDKNDRIQNLETSMSRIAKSWYLGWFSNTACGYCDDTFAETADVVFMDAWLEKYSHDYRGTSLVIVRNNIAKPILELGRENKSLFLNKVSYTDLLESQSAVIKKKRLELGYRLFMASKNRAIGIVPKKRVLPNREISLIDKISIRCIDKMHSKAKFFLWKNSLGPEDIATFNRKVAYLDKMYGFVFKLNRLFKN